MASFSNLAPNISPWLHFPGETRSPRPSRNSRRTGQLPIPYLAIVLVLYYMQFQSSSWQLMFVCGHVYRVREGLLET